jgi:hypothetical protein
MSEPRSPRLTLVVMAAGIGSRYGGLKQIQPVGPGGEAVLDYSVFDALRAGFGRAVFVIRREIEEAFRSALGRRFESRMDVRYVFQELGKLPPSFAVPAGRQKPWGTGHALLCACEALAEPCAVINADDFYGADAYRVLAQFLSRPAEPAGPETFAMVGYRLSHTLSEHGSVARGVCRVDPQGCLASVEELTAIERTPAGVRHKEADGRFRPLTGEEVVSLNCWGFSPSIGAHLQRLFAAFLERNRENPKAEFYIPAAVNDLIAAGQARVWVLPTSASWFGVTYREDLPFVIESIRALVRAGAYPERLWT